MDQQILIWLVAAFAGIATPLLGYLSPFGRLRRSMVDDLQKQVDVLTKRVDQLMAEVKTLNEKLAASDLERTRLERDNYRLYRELDTARAR